MGRDCKKHTFIKPKEGEHSGACGVAATKSLKNGGIPLEIPEVDM